MYDVDIYVLHKCAEHTQWLQFPAHIQNIDMKAERYNCLRLEYEHFDVLRIDSTPHKTFV